MKKPTVYLANNCGFSPTNKLALSPVITTLEQMGFTVWEPFSRENDVTTAGVVDPLKIAAGNIKDIENCDLVFAILNGEPPDNGVFFELGYAAAIGKPRAFFRDDFRICTDAKGIPANLMITSNFNNLTDFTACCYFSVEELTDNNKVLAQLIK